MLRIRFCIVSILAPLLSGCGVFYTVPQVSEGPISTSAYASDLDVQVVALTYETAAAANLEPFTPPRAPRAFQPGAEEQVRLASARGPNLPPIPPATSRRIDRPETIAERLPPVVEPERYRIGVGDVVLLTVDAEATTIGGVSALISAQSKRQGYTVQDDGAISLPDAGDIRIAGMTLGEAEEAVFRALVGAGLEPSFTLEIAEFNSQIVSVGGVVGSPQLIPVSLQPLTLEKALNLAGGVTAIDPSITMIQIYREGEIYTIRLDRYLADPSLGKRILKDGDSVFVGSPYLREEADRYFSQQLTLRGLALESYDRQRGLELDSEERIQAQLERERALFKERLELGMVERPYAFVAGEPGTSQIELPFDRAASLSDVLFSKDAGKLNLAFADYGEIYVLRRERDPQKVGGVTAYHLNAENAANLIVATQFQIRPNDVIFVASQPLTNWNRVISQLTPQLFFSIGQQVAFQ